MEHICREERNPGPSQWPEGDEYLPKAILLRVMESKNVVKGDKAIAQNKGGGALIRGKQMSGANK